MPPKRHGPTSQNTAKRPRTQGPIQYKRRHIQAIGCEKVARVVVGKVASAVVGRMAGAVVGGW